MFANTQMGGVDTGFPDVCMTPAVPSPVPLPYPNIAAGPMGVPPVAKVLFMCAPAHNLSTTIKPTNGDNPGVATGVASGTVMMTARHLTAAFTVVVGGMPATRMTSVAIQNNTNCPGVRIAPSQVKVILLAP
jgi:hypothetical protein